MDFSKQIKGMKCEKKINSRKKKSNIGKKKTKCGKTESRKMKLNKIKEILMLKLSEENQRKFDVDHDGTKARPNSPINFGMVYPNLKLGSMKLDL